MEDQILDTSLSQQESPNSGNLVYSTFGSRLAAAILDGLIVGALGLCLLALNFINKSMYFVTVPVQIAFTLFYYIYLVQANGATPGKRVMNLKIVRTDGTPVDSKDAFIRYLPFLILGVIGQLITLAAVNAIDADTYDSLGWFQRMQHIGTIYPVATTTNQYINFAWIIVDIIVFFTNKERRALHDKIAGTVVISTQ